MSGRKMPRAEYTGKHRRVSGLAASSPHTWGSSTPVWGGGTGPDGRLIPGSGPLRGRQNDDGQWPEAGQRADAS
jgi:hypothetical protein